MFDFFKSKSNDDLSIEIKKEDIFDMKEKEGMEDIVSKQLLHTPVVVDRRALMFIEKTFVQRYKKVGHITQTCPHCKTEYRSMTLGEKKCSHCKNKFYVLKRVQDMATVAIREDQISMFDVQWKAVSDSVKFKHYLASEYEYMKKKLQKEKRIGMKESDVMHLLIDAYAKNSLTNGFYQLYAAFLFHKAELMRSESNFSEALSYYLYVYFLHCNGVTNKASFSHNTTVNSELRERIVTLLELGNIQVKNIKELYEYSVLHLNRFNMDILKINMNKSYLMLCKEFREEDVNKELIKPMRSFRLHKAS